VLCSPLANKKVLPLHFTSPNVLFDFEQHSGHTFKPLDEVYDQHVSSITDEVGFFPTGALLLALAQSIY